MKIQFSVFPNKRDENVKLWVQFIIKELKEFKSLVDGWYMFLYI